MTIRTKTDRGKGFKLHKGEVDENLRFLLLSSSKNSICYKMNKRTIPGSCCLPVSDDL